MIARGSTDAAFANHGRGQRGTAVGVGNRRHVHGTHETLVEAAVALLDEARNAAVGWYFAGRPRGPRERAERARQHHEPEQRQRHWRPRHPVRQPQAQ